MNSERATWGVDGGAGGERLGSWDRLTAEARRRWPVLRASSASIVIGNRSKRIRLDQLPVAEPALDADTYVAVRVEIAPEDRIDPLSALKLNADLLVGSFCVRDGGYELRWVTNLSCLSIAYLDKMLGYLGKLGDAFRREVEAPGATDLTCFNYLVD